MNLDLRPLTVSELLDRTFSIYRHRFLLFVALMAPQAVLSLVAALIWGAATGSMRTSADFELEHVAGVLIAAGIGVLLFTIAHWVLYVVGIGATTITVSDLYGRLTPDVGSAYAATARRLGPLLWLTFLMAVRLLGVMAACLVVPGALLGAAGGMTALQSPDTTVVGSLAVAGFVLMMLGMVVAFAIMVFMGLRYAVAIPAVVLEPVGGRDAIRRSVRLTRGLLGRAFLLMICAAVISWVAAMVLQMPFAVAMLVAGPETRTGFWLNMIGIATGTAGQTITAPIVAIGVVVLYFDARIRHEALDLQVMTEALAPAPPPTGPGFVTAPPPVPH